MQVSIIVAVSADGFIARDAHELTTTWNSKEDRKIFVELTKRAGVFVLGGNTYRTFGHALPGRRKIVYSRSVINEPGIETTQEAPADLIARLSADGFTELAVCGGTAIYDMFLRAGLVTDIYLTIEPVLFGKGLSLVESSLDVPLQLVESRALNANTLLIHYRIATSNHL